MKMTNMTTMIRTYSELIKYDSFEDRFQYLKLDGLVGEETFGYDRYINQIFYNSDEWKRTRRDVIVRDNGCDLGIEGFDIHSKILIHHMNPINVNDIIERSDYLMNPEYLICVSFKTHNAIHYGDEHILDDFGFVERKPNDMCPWRK